VENLAWPTLHCGFFVSVGLLLSIVTILGENDGSSVGFLILLLAYCALLVEECRLPELATFHLTRWLVAKENASIYAGAKSSAVMTNANPA